MRILHVASFSGNIGDSISRTGLFNLLDNFADLTDVTDHTTLEIRDFYIRKSNRKKFDESFITYANKFDLLLIGGGGFLDYWVTESSTGTTLDLPPKLLDKLTVPTLIASVGCTPRKKNIPERNVERLRGFLDVYLSKTNTGLLVRNDGSKDYIKNEIGNEYSNQIPEILDFGFFHTPVSGFFDNIHYSDVCINLTKDQIELDAVNRAKIDKHLYHESLLKVVEYLTEGLGLRVKFVPHVAQDLTAISDFIHYLPSEIINSYCSVAPFTQGETSITTSLYSNSLLNIATRYHANVASLCADVPTAGLIALDRVEYIHKQLENSVNVTYLDVDDFSPELIQACKEGLDKRPAAKIKENIKSLRRKTVSEVETFLSSQGLI